MTDKHKADLDRVSSQNNFTDFARDAAEHPHAGGLRGLVNSVIRAAAAPTPYGEAMVARTEFDTRSLNEMVDLVEQTNPEDLESSGKALWDARDAIKAAAEELRGQFETVPWVGKAGDDFRTWGSGLVSSAHDLSAFAGGAGDQITAAAVGLASVRGAMPPRDPANRKRPSHFTAAEKAANKEEYADAVKVEKDRQEAINQMNRLASYYAVSREQLQVLHDDAPTFKDVPDVGIPKPKTAQRDVSGGTDSSTPQQTGTASVPVGHSSIAPTARHVVVPAGDVPTPAQDLPTHTEVPDRPVGTNIDTVGTLPPTTTTTTPSTGHTPPVPGTPPASGGGQFPPYNGPLGTPVTGGPTGRGLSGAGGFRTPTSAQGGTRAPGAAGPGSGRSTGQGPMNQMGRATSTGQSAGGTTSGAKPTSMGRAVTGGTPRPGGTAAPRTGSGPTTGAGRSNGVVGGRPSNAGSASKGGSRIPRGTVVGREEGVSSRPATGRNGQRGVIGAPEPAARPGTGAANSRRGGAGPEAVTGRPSDRNSVARAERNGMTRGGAGLGRGAGRNGKPAEEEEVQRSARPDYLVEDEETHLPNRPRRDVPPVVD
ncbi:hypothetical protein [Streptomyces sp. NPDC004014]